MIERKQTAKWAAIAIALFTPLTGWAALGGNVDSVQADQQQLKATVQTTQNSAYTLHEMQAEGGVIVREYVSQQGKVFGVTWEGPARPDLRQLLGQYYEQFVNAVEAAKSQQVGRRPLAIQEPDLVVQFSGHQRAYTGRAYVPQMVPSGMRAEEIR